MNYQHQRLLGLRPILFWIVSALIGIAAFIPAIVAWFTAEELVLLYAVRDDPFAIWSGREGQTGFFRPVIPMIMWLWQQLFELEPRPYHLLNVFLHAANSWLVYVIARQWTAYLPDGHKLRRTAAAALAALWFWIWPAHSEPVSWIPALTDVAAATFALASLAAYLKFRTGGRWQWALAGVLLYCTALCAKESAITLPAVLFIYELIRAVSQGTWRWRDGLWPMVFAFTMLGYFLLRRLLLGAFLGGYGAGIHENFSWERLQYSLSPNLANAFLPLPWLDVYQKNWMLPAFAVSCGIALVWRRGRGEGAGSVMAIPALAVCAVLVFLPGLNLGPGLIIEGQRFAYLASAFGVISVAFTAVYILPVGRALTITAWFVAIGFAGLLAWYNNSWYIAGKVARQIVREMDDLPPARRTYVLTTTDNYREAFILPHGLDAVYKLMAEDRQAGELVLASVVTYWNPDVQVKVRPLEPAVSRGETGYWIWLSGSGPKTPVSPKLEGFTDPFTAQLFDVKQQGSDVSVTLKDYNPASDQVYFISGGDLVRVE